MKRVILLIASVSLLLLTFSCKKEEEKKEYWQVVVEEITAVSEETERVFLEDITALNEESPNYDVTAAVEFVEEVVGVYDGIVSGRIILNTSTDGDNWVEYASWTLVIPEPEYEYVDLGLSSGVKWAVHNIGAESPEEVGDYFAWGEISTKSEYTSANYSFYGLEIYDISGNPEYDAATANWGPEWRMPTQADYEELLSVCNWEWFENNGNGYFVVTSAIGKQITIPAGGYFVDSAATGAGIAGMYWTSNCVIDATGDKAVNVFLRSLYQLVNQQDRSFGMNIRPVRD
ncbi:MAG: hypothetical protein J6U51_02660 [Bacteroidales bacterium]|nr:hypothetical protein [Bacteroidales bacterium]